MVFSVSELLERVQVFGGGELVTELSYAGPESIDRLFAE